MLLKQIEGRNDRNCIGSMWYGGTGGRKEKITFSRVFRNGEVNGENKDPLILEAVGKKERKEGTCFSISSRPR